MGKILDGKKYGEAVKNNFLSLMNERKYDSNSFVPTLAIIQVGHDNASDIYVRNKIKYFEEIGKAILINFENNITNVEMLDKIEELNNDENIDGIIVQLPLPTHLQTEMILRAIDKVKDVDGFYSDIYVPCTPKGIIDLVESNDISFAGRDVTIVGRGRTVGKSLASLLSSKYYDATVTLCHTKTKDLASHTKNADIIISAVGSPNLITSDMVKDGAVIIDVGVNKISDSTKKSGFRTVGDCEASVYEKSSYYTPPVGGVGPCTVASLYLNTYKAYTINNQKAWF